LLWLLAMVSVIFWGSNCYLPKALNSRLGE
jgi:hypothetical protein